MALRLVHLAVTRIFSGPWLSQTIKELERLLGEPLLTRTTRSVTLTDSGAIFANLAGRAIQDLESAASTVANRARGPHPAITLGYTIGAGLDIVPGLLRTFATKHPDVVVPIADLEPCRVALAWWPDTTVQVADLVVANGVVSPAGDRHA